jgi:hypothetical protein
VTKQQFLKYCRTHEKGSGVALRVSWGKAYRDMEYSVRLHGCWYGESIAEVELYRPQPGNQWPEWEKCVVKCEAATSKFERWLQEFFESAAEE